jgi:hypothetical protein
VLNDEREAKLAEQYRLQGVVRSGYDGMEVELVGGKFNLTDVAARVGLGQLPHLEEFTPSAASSPAPTSSCSPRRRRRRSGLRLPVADFTQQQLAHVPGRAARGAADRSSAPT